jgi:ABC-type antimicrobial peptide transport system permease subunit
MGLDMLDTVRRAIRDVDPLLPVLSLETLTAHRDSSLPVWMVKAGASVFTGFGLIALLLSVIGVYGLRAYLVARRTREIGIRVALGAGPRDVLVMILREGLSIAAAGMTVGILLAVGTGYALSSAFYGVAPFDPLILIGAPLVLTAAILGACYLPARRAMRMTPMSALRS